MKEEITKLALDKGFAQSSKMPYLDAYYMWLCLLHKWLREKHNTRIEITMDQGEAKATITERNDSKYHIGGCESYQEALERSGLAALRILK